jgi:hypothetical protein
MYCLYICTTSISLLNVQQPSRGSRSMEYSFTGPVDERPIVTTATRRSCLRHASTCQFLIGTAHGTMQPLNAQYPPPSSELILTMTSPFALHPVTADAQSNTISMAYCISPSYLITARLKPSKEAGMVANVTSCQARLAESLVREDV